MHQKLIDRLGGFIDIEREIRNASNTKELGFVVCNLTKKIVNYDTAILLQCEKTNYSVQTVSGTSEFEKNAPLVELAELVAKLSISKNAMVSIVGPKDFDSDVANKFYSLQIQELVVSELDRSVSSCTPGPARLIFMREIPWQVHELKIIEQLSEVVEHALVALRSKQRKNRLKNLFSVFKPKKLIVMAALTLLAFVPVKQSIIADGEITARSPSVLSTPIQGVIKEISVRPNDVVSKGQVILRLDDVEVTHQKRKIKKEIELASERLRKATQEALGRQQKRNVLAQLQSELTLKEIELEYLVESSRKLELRALSDGIVLFSSVKDWLGKAVSAGEKIMELASVDDKQFEIWVAANDAIALNEESPVKFFPSAFPLQSIVGNVDTVSFYSRNTADGVMSYRVLGSIENNETVSRLGMKGTVRIYGEKVSLGYYLLRKPLSAVRQSVGI